MHHAPRYGRPKNPIGSSSSVVIVQLQSRTWPSASKHLRQPRKNGSVGCKISQHRTVATGWFATAEYHQRHCYTGKKRSPSICIKIYLVLQCEGPTVSALRSLWQNKGKTVITGHRCCSRISSLTSSKAFAFPDLSIDSLLIIFSRN